MSTKTVTIYSRSGRTRQVTRRQYDRVWAKHPAWSTTKPTEATSKTSKTSKTGKS